MEARYLRNIPALSEAECALLRQKRVLIVGCGGLGGHLLDQLLRLGIGSIRVCDKDVFEESNLNRQLLASADTLGKSKAQAAARYAERVNPDVELQAWDCAMTEENAQVLIRDCDGVLDALDNVKSRKLLAAACSAAGIPYIYGAVGGWTAQAAVCLPGDSLLNVLYPEDREAEDKSVLSFTPALCASLQAALCVHLLTGRLEEHGKLYYFDLLNREFETIPLDIPK